MNSANLAKYILGFSVIMAILAMLGLALFRGVPDSKYADMAIGALLPILTLVVNFFFRRASSKEKETTVK